MVYRGKEAFGEYTLSVPGRHNVQNALACIAVCDCLGLDRGRVATELASFRGAKRRFEVVAEENGVLVIDDYAHHPSEIQATLQAAKSAWNRRVVAVFQPHRYSRTGQLMDEFAGSFRLGRSRDPHRSVCTSTGQADPWRLRVSLGRACQGAD